MNQRKCDQCGRDFSKSHPAARFCSYACKNIFHEARAAEKRRLAHGERSCCWCSQPLRPEQRTGSFFCNPKCQERYDNAWTSNNLRDATKSARDAKTCLHCGKQLVCLKSTKKYCSKQCLNAERDPKRYPAGKRPPRPPCPPRTCEECGTEYVPTKNTKRSFCSRNCAGRKHNNEQLAKRHSKILDRKAGRLCEGCGTALGPEKLRSARFCTSKCAARSSMLLAKFGLTQEAFNNWLTSQSGGCKVCHTTNPGVKGWQIDHDRSCCPDQKSCGKCLRGILCTNCNTALGMFHDDIGVLQSAIAYLQERQAKLAPPPVDEYLDDERLAA